LRLLMHWYSTVSWTIHMIWEIRKGSCSIFKRILYLNLFTSWLLTDSAILVDSHSVSVAASQRKDSAASLPTSVG
jgi:hypothetical protein